MFHPLSLSIFLLAIHFCWGNLSPHPIFSPSDEFSDVFSWKYDFSRFPSLWFGANEYGFQNTSTQNLIMKHALAGFGWQQGTKRTNFRFCETSIAQAVAMIRSKSPDLPLFAYRHSQGAFPMFELSREAEIAEEEATKTPSPSPSPPPSSPFLHSHKNGQVCVQDAPGGGFAMLYNWSSPATHKLWLESMIAEVDGESGVSAVFFDETDWSYCGYFSTEMSNCSNEFVGEELEQSQMGKWTGLKEIAAKLNSARIIPLYSSFNSFSSSLLPQPLAPSSWGDCVLPEEGLVKALEGVLWLRFYEFWVSTGSAADDAKMISNAMVETADGRGKGYPAGIVARQNLNQTDPMKSVSYGIAAFYIVQTEYSYYGVSTDWYDDNWQWWPQYDQGGCGAPTGNGKKISEFKFEREFQHCSVSVDTETQEGIVKRK